MPVLTSRRWPGASSTILERVEIEAGIAGVRTPGDRRALVEALDPQRHPAWRPSANGEKRAATLGVKRALTRTPSGVSSRSRSPAIS